MQQLSVVGLSSDGNRLLLINDAGNEFSVAVDSRLRAALRGDQTRLGQLEIPMESALRPRDIQSRIRAGESAEAVAQAAQTTVDKIMAFAAPVLAERAHMADRAQRSSVRRGPDAPPGAPRTLGDAVAESLLALEVSPSTLEWDAWRREDGRWRLVADYTLGGKATRATFSYDVPGQYVVPEDDAARILIGEKQPRSAAPKQTPPAGPRRLSAVADSELPLGDDAIALVHDLDAEVEEVTRLRAAAEEAESTGSTATDDSNAPAAPAAETDADPDREQTVDLTEAADAVRRQPEAPAEKAQDEPAAEAPSAPEAESEAEPEPKPEPKPKSRKRRSSVPSWDEIMFGGGGGRRD